MPRRRGKRVGVKWDRTEVREQAEEVYAKRRTRNVSEAKNAERENRTMKVKVKKLDENAKLPAYGSPYAAGADLYAAEGAEIPAGETRFVRTGIAVELPANTVGLVYARSGLASKRDLAPANKVGVIDCDYRGEILVALHNHGKETRTVAGGERVAQLVVAPYYVCDFEESESLSETERGAGGFGSTGRH